MGNRFTGKTQQHSLDKIIQQDTMSNLVPGSSQGIIQEIYQITSEYGEEREKDKIPKLYLQFVLEHLASVPWICALFSFLVKVGVLQMSYLHLYLY